MSGDTTPPRPVRYPPNSPRVSGADETGDAPSVGLTFVDLLYAVPVADLATRISETHLHHVTASGWLDVAVALAAITFGWVGHHTNRQRMPDVVKRLRRETTRPFTEPRFIQFLVEIMVIAAYYALGARAFLPDGAGVGSASEVWKGQCLTALFLLYLVWDTLDVHISKPADGRLDYWSHRALRGRRITICFTAVFVAFLAWAELHGRPQSVVVFDILAILSLYGYRLVQELYLYRGDLRGWPKDVKRLVEWLPILRRP